MPPDSDPTHDPHGPWHPTPRGIYRGPPRGGWHATKCQHRMGWGNGQGMLRHTRANHPTRLISRAGIFPQHGRPREKKVQSKKDVQRHWVLLALGRTARHGTTVRKWKAMRQAPCLNSGGACGRVYRNEGKGLHGFKRKRKFPTERDVCLCWLGWLVGLGNEWRR